MKSKHRAWSREIIRVWPIAIAMALVTAVAACGSDDTTRRDNRDAGVDTNAGDADSGESDARQAQITPCEDSSQCAGGEACIDGGCRESCDESRGDGCEGALAICNNTLGYCVGCVAHDDCGAGRRCDFGDGLCISGDCAEDIDCPGGHRCIESACVPIDPLVCEPFSITCEQNTVVVCSRDGLTTQRVACSSQQGCVEDDSGDARCMNTVCEPHSIGCIDDSTAFLCDDIGVQQTELPCREGQRCVDGVCRLR